MERDDPVRRGAGGPPEEAQREPWERKIGAHMLWFEPPDVLCMRPSGPVSRDELAELLGVFTEVAGQVPIMLGLMNISALGPLSTEARQFALKWPKPTNAVTAIYGASFRQRVMLDLLRRAARLFGRKDTTMNFFDTEGEARAFLEESKRARAGGSG